MAGAAGVVFCACGLKHPARAQWLGAPDAPHHSLPVRVGGRRVRTIDVHAHCYFADALITMFGVAEGHTPNVKGAREHFIPADDKAAVEGRLRAMDRMGVDLEVLSTNPFWYPADRDLSEKVVRIHNERLAELTHAYPDRFAGFCGLSLQHPDLAVRELEDAIRNKGLKGAAIGGHVEGLDFADPKFHPVWAKAQDLGAVLFIHPQSPPELDKRLKGNGWMANTVGNPLDTTIALEHLIFQGTLDRFPELKVIAAHGGGFLPSYAARMDHPCYVSPTNCDAAIKLKLRPTEYLKRLYYDVLVFTPEALRHLIAEVGVDRLMLGTDHPIPWEEFPLDLLFDSKFLTNAQRRAIAGGNAAKLLKL